MRDDFWIILVLFRWSIRRVVLVAGRRLVGKVLYIEQINFVDRIIQNVVDRWLVETAGLLLARSVIPADLCRP